MESSHKREFILHPFLFAAYPVIALLANNIEEIDVVVALRALLVSLACGLLTFLVLKQFFRDGDKPAILTALILVLFFSYGHVYNYLEGNQLLGFGLGRHRLLAPIWVGLLIIGVIWIWRLRSNLRTLNQALNWIASAAVIFPLLQIGSYTARSISVDNLPPSDAQLIQGLKRPDLAAAPDIYYIILDAYARDDTLSADHNFDNKPFLNELEELGFYIARCSQSNYSQTQLSLASSLNMDYLQSLGGPYTPGNTSRLGVDDLIQHSALRQILEALGYETIAFETGFKYTQWEDADIYLSPSANPLEKMQIGGGLNDFEVMLLRTSAGLLLADGATLVPKILVPDFNNPRRVHRERILFDLKQLALIPEIPGPKLVFAHLVTPHPPYVFGPNGEFTDYDLEARQGYIDQIKYINSRLIPLMQEIIYRSPIPPIIILQGDHGAIHSPPAERLNILNAYYLPGSADQSLYEKISPVNTFRVVLNSYFGGQYPILDDISYFSVYKTPYDFTIIPNTRPGCSGDGRIMQGLKFILQRQSAICAAR